MTRGGPRRLPFRSIQSAAYIVAIRSGLPRDRAHARQRGQGQALILGSPSDSIPRRNRSRMCRANWRDKRGARNASGRGALHRDCHLDAKHILVRPGRIPVPRSVSATRELGVSTAKRGTEFIFGLVLAAEAASS
jgi:hypothetical protein